MPEIIFSKKIKNPNRRFWIINTLVRNWFSGGLLWDVSAIVFFNFFSAPSLRPPPPYKKSFLRPCIINSLQLFVEKRQFFNQNNQWLNNIIYQLNRQFTVVLNSIICFSEQFCNNSLLGLKIAFSRSFLLQA